MALAILSTLLCCLPLGVVAIVFAAQVNGKWRAGDEAGAQESARKARQFGMLSAIIGVLLYAIGGVALGVGSTTGQDIGVSTILWALIGGAIIGILGKWVAPGDREVPLWATVLCGVGGVFLGNWLYVDVFNFRASTSGLDWWRHVWQIGVAAILVISATSIMSRSKAADPG